MIDRYKAGAEPTLTNAAKIAMALSVPLSALAPEGLFSDVDVGDLQRDVMDRDERIMFLEGTILQMSQANEVARLNRGGASPGDAVLVPRLNVRVAAGIGKVNYHERDDVDKVPLSRSILRRLGVQPENAHFITVEGDSMEEEIKDRDDVLVDVGDQVPRPSGIYAVQYGDEAMLKRVQPFELMNTINLISDNPRYPPISIKGDERKRLRTIGRAKLVMRVL